MDKSINLFGKTFLLSKMIFMVLTLLVSCVSVIFDVCFVGVLIDSILFIAYLFAYQSDDLFCVKWIITTLVSTNFFIGIISYHFGIGTSSLMYMTQLATMYIYLLPLVYLFKNKKIILNQTLEKLFMVILVIIVFYFFAYSYKNLGIINYFRNFTIFGFVFLIGKYIVNSKEKLLQLLKFIVNLSFFIVLIGLVLYFCDYSVYEFLGIQNVYIAKGAVFKTNDFDDRFNTTLISTEFFRMGSILYEPINLSYFLIVPTIVSLFSIKNNKVNAIKFIVILVGLVLTFGKGGYLLLAAVVGAYLIYNICKLFFESNKVCFFLSLIIMLFGVIVFTLFYAKNIGAAATTHFVAIEKTLKSLNEHFLFGKGLGSGGNYGAQLDGWLESGGETGLMSMVYQMGIIFTFLVILFFAILSYKNIQKAKSGMDIALSFLPIFTIIVYIYQENTLAPQCIFLIMLITGAMQSKKGVINDESLLGW